MSTFEIQVDSRSADALLDRLANMDLTKPLATTARLMDQEVRNTFRDQKDPWGEPWPPHSPVTTAIRRHKGNASDQILVDKGDMYDSITNGSTPDTAFVSMDGPAEVHQFGSTTAGRGNKVSIPPRPTFPIGEEGPPDSWWDTVTAPILAYAEKVAQP